MRKNGILMHISSLPSPYGIGTMGKAARDFVDFLEAAGQSCWQILPICPTSYGDSPYQSFSTYAGNPYFIDLDDLRKDGLLKASEYRKLNWGNDPETVDFGTMYATRFPVLRLAVNRLWEREGDAIHSFCWQQGEWIHNYAIFMSVKGHFGGDAWQTWPMDIRTRQPEALQEMETLLADEILFWKGIQYLFFQQWAKLKQYANDRGISIIGDVPIYVAGDSVDVWSNPNQFQLDEDLLPTNVAGCPPDGFTADGQLWGNPLFDWEKMEEEGFWWWINRIRYQCSIYDILRIDHFRGFDAYYAIPYGDETAKNGVWQKGPGIAFFQAVEKAIGKQNIIAEDLGFLTPSVYEMLEETGFPGMKVLQFAFDSRDSESGYLPHCFPKNCVAYIGTHDNDTILGWLKTAPKKDVAFAKEYLRLNQEEGYNWGMMRSLWMSTADLTVVQMQDVMELGIDARMNTPGLVGKNWQWRALPGSYTKKLAKKLRHEMALYSRLPAPRLSEEEVEETAEIVVIPEVPEVAPAAE